MDYHQNHSSSSICYIMHFFFNPLSANPTKWSNTLKQFVSILPTNCLSEFDHFVGLALKVLNVGEQLRWMPIILNHIFYPTKTTGNNIFRKLIKL